MVPEDLLLTQIILIYESKVTYALLPIFESYDMLKYCDFS